MHAIGTYIPGDDEDGNDDSSGSSDDTDTCKHPRKRTSISTTDDAAVKGSVKVTANSRGSRKL